MSKSKYQKSLANVNVLLLWKRGEDKSLLENVTVTIYENGIVEIGNHTKQETLVTHIRNVVIIDKSSQSTTL